ncbi:hypothetical protein EV126DRAFT_413968 [Verticillium dahliae]|nr:hypothetical protein EV126DRAFT_413968 [Verticillium dahliae]
MFPCSTCRFGTIRPSLVGMAVGWSHLCLIMYVRRMLLKASVGALWSCVCSVHTICTWSIGLPYPGCMAVLLASGSR